MEDLTQYRLKKIEEEIAAMKKEVTPWVERQKFVNEWTKLIIAGAIGSAIGASAREIIIFISQHVKLQ